MAEEPLQEVETAGVPVGCLVPNFATVGDQSEAETEELEPCGVLSDLASHSGVFPFYFGRNGADGGNRGVAQVSREERRELLVENEIGHRIVLRPGAAQPEDFAAANAGGS